MFWIMSIKVFSNVIVGYIFFCIRAHIDACSLKAILYQSLPSQWIIDQILI